MTLRYLLLTALRDRLIGAVLVALIAIWLISAFAGATSITEDRAAAVVFAAFAARLLVILGIVLFAALQLRRIGESGELHLMLAKPVSRARFVVEAWGGLAVIAAGMAVAAGFAVGLASLPRVPGAGLGVWTGTLALEAVVMAAFALFVALGLRGVIAGLLTCLGFYAFTRMLGVLLAIVSSKFAPSGAFADWLGTIVHGLSLMLPRLDLFAQSRWLVYGVETVNTVALPAVQGAVYAGVLLAAAVFDARGRAF